MADVATLKELIYKLQLEATGLETGLKNAEKETTKFSGKMKTIGKKIKKHWLGLTAAIGGVVIGIKKAFDFTKEYTKYKQGMNALARNTGMNANKIIAKLKEVSKGTIANKDLMLAANRAVALGVTKDVGTIAKLLEIARVKAKAMGTDTTQAFDDIVTGIGRGSPLILDNLGIITKGWQEEAKAKGVSYDKQFMLNKILEQGAEELKKPGAQALTSAERMARLTATFSDFKVELGKVLSSVLVPFIGKITKMLKWFIKLPAPIKQGTVALIGVATATKVLSVALSLLNLNPVMLMLTAAAGTAIFLINKLSSGVEKAQKMKDLLNGLEGSNVSRGMSKELKRVNGYLTILINKYNVLDYLYKKNLTDEQKHYVEKYKQLIKYKKTLEATIKQEEKRLKQGLKGTYGKKNKSNDTTLTQVEQNKAVIEDYYNFINNKYELNKAKLEEQSQKAVEALANELNIKKSMIEDYISEKNDIELEDIQNKYDLTQEQLSQLTNLKASYLIKQETLEREHNNKMGILQREALKTYGVNWEQLTAKQKIEINKQAIFVTNFLNDFKSGIKSAMTNVVSDYASGIADMIVEGKKFKKSFKDFITEILKDVAKLIIKLIIIKGLMAILNIATGGISGGITAFLGFSRGGVVPKGGKIKPVYASTGFEPKGTDTVPAMLTPGERVLSVNQNKNFEQLLSNLANRPQKNVVINNSYNITSEVIDEISFREFTKKIMREQEEILTNNEAIV